MATPADSIQNICSQRRIQMQFNVPPVRLIPISPYSQEGGGYTQAQLDMRRKAEILAYSSNRMPTQTNNITKLGRWSQIVRGSYRNNYCPNDETIPTPTSSCNVPGPIMMLYKDPTIPLYNFATNNDAYAIINSETPSGWTIVNNSDIQCFSETDTNFATLIIRDIIENSSYRFSIFTPMAIYVNGTTTSSGLGNQSITLTIPSIICTVYYNNNSVISVSSQNSPNLISLNGTSISSFTKTITIRAPSNIGTGTFNYSAVVYLGTLSISGLNLPTVPGYVYEFNIGTQVTAELTNISNSYTYGTYINVSQGAISTYNSPPNNINTISTQYNGSYTPFELSGI